MGTLYESLTTESYVLTACLGVERQACQTPTLSSASVPLSLHKHSNVGTSKPTCQIKKQNKNPESCMPRLVSGRAPSRRGPSQVLSIPCTLAGWVTKR